MIRPSVLPCSRRPVGAPVVSAPTVRRGRTVAPLNQSDTAAPEVRSRPASPTTVTR
jgi:hypothetical protein